MSLAAVAAGGCGSTTGPGSDRTSAAAAAPNATTAHFIAAADQICGVLRSQQGPLNARAQKLTTDTAATRALLATLLRESVAFARAADTKLKALPRPPSDATSIGKLLTGYETESAEVAASVEALVSQQPEKQRFASGSLERTTAADHALAAGLGLKICAGSA
jgi:hypothetical protein